jgi:hypothetical protein
MNRQIERVFSKPCKWCGKNAIFWSDIHKYFADGPNSDSPKHQCPASSKVDQDKRLNEILADLKTENASKFTSLESRFDNIQRTMLHQNSIIVELKAKIDGILRSG